MSLVLGIDPGSQFTGFGAIRIEGHGRTTQLTLVCCGVIAPPVKLEFNQRIGIIAEELEILIDRLKPKITVIERVFLGKNADSAFKLGHARGLAVATAVRGGSEIVEYATRSVKKGITGSGAATKEQVQMVLFAALGIREAARADASDALALAYYHARNIEALVTREMST